MELAKAAGVRRARWVAITVFIIFALPVAHAGASEWSLQPTPNPALPPAPVSRSELAAVSCPSASLCLASGYDANFGQYFEQRWNGSEWLADENVDEQLSSSGSRPQGIACPSSEECLAVGYFGSEAVVEVRAEYPEWGWLTVEVTSLPPIEGAGSVRLNDVSCPSEESCTAVGSYVKAGTTKTLALRLTRKAQWEWSASVQSTANPGSGSAQLSDVSCSSVAACMAVGTHGPETFAESWNGSSWSIASTPNPEGAEHSYLEAISCPSSSACAAVGRYTTEVPSQQWKEWEESGELEEWEVSPEEWREYGFAEEVEEPLALRWNGSSWSTQSAPLPSGAKEWARLWDVACTGAPACTAVGSYATKKEPIEEKTLSLAWDGSKWSVSETPNPKGRAFSQLSGISCGTPSACEAVGMARNSGSERVTLGEGYFEEDTTPPDTTITSGPSGATETPNVSFAFEATEVPSSLSCSLDEAAFSPCSSLKSFIGLAAGPHVFRVRAKDSTGNVDETPAERDFEIIPPDTSITAGPSGLISKATAQFSFESSVLGAQLKCSLDGGPFSPCFSPKIYEGIADGSHQFQVRAEDSAGNPDQTPAQRSFEVDTTAPQTTIDSPQPSYTSHETWPIEFSANEPGATFKCSLDDPSGKPKTTCSPPYALPEHLEPGFHTFVVAATDEAGNTEPNPTEWTFDTAIYPDAPSTSKLVSPDEGTKSASYLTLKSEWQSPIEGAGVSSIAYQLKVQSWDAFKSIPPQYLWDSDGDHPNWAIDVDEGATSSPLLFFDVKAFAEAEGWGPVMEGLQLRPVFNGGASVAGASKPVTTTYSRFAGGSADAMEQIGPASIDLLTGAFTITRTDVSIPVPGSEANLEFTRTYNSAWGANEKTNSKTLGQMWQPSAPVESEYEEEAWQKLLVQHKDAVPPKYDPVCQQEIKEYEEELKEFEEWEGPQDPEICLEEYEIPEQNWVEVLDSEGAGIPFERVGNKAPYAYVPPEEAKEFALSEAGGSFILSDSSGTKTEFTQNGTTNEYVPSKVSYAGTSKQARLTYGISEGKKRLLSAIGPAPSGATCNPLEGEANYAPKTKGCRSLYFTYINFTIEGSPSQQRLDRITYYDSSGSGGGQIVARYGYYSASGNLSEEWDPRITPQALKERYAYESTEDARLTRITPAGEEPWQLAYYPADSGGPYEAKLKSVSRASLLKSGPSTATTTIAYGVPISGEGAPYDLGVSAISKWDQSDYPVDATAIFPPTEVPGEEPSDYDQATIHYLDAGGHEVNTASPAPPGVEDGAITTAETDLHGNVVRELSAQNRLRALQAEDPAERSHELDSHSEYSADGTEMLQSWSPLHEVRLESGETIQARRHTEVKYDEGAPELKEGETAPRLPTTETVGAVVPGKEEELEPRVGKTAYNWELRRSTEQITDPKGLNLISKTIYNAAGQVIQERQPSDPEGKRAGTTKTVYWTAGANSEESKCGNKPAWAGLPCLSRPVAEPTPVEGNPKLPWTHFVKYSTLDQLEESYEEINTGIERKTTTTYDAAGRPLTTHQTGRGTEVPPIETTYDEETGRPLSQQFVCESECEGFDQQQTRTEYDALGRPIEYEDADGNKSGVVYDLLGRPMLSTDGKGYQEIAYDEESGVATEMTDSAAGTFKAIYNADGQMIEQLLPNGLAQQIEYDEAGVAIGLSYEKETYCTSACTWLSFDREDSIAGQVLRETSTLGTHEYDYDKAGRLTLAEETLTGDGCTSRAYAFDEDSNRLSRTTRGPKAGGGCDTESAGEEQKYAYDTADRLIGDGVEYDNLGRITSLPARYAGPGESWHVDGETLSEAGLESVPFASEGKLALTFASLSLRLECDMYSYGHLSGAEGIEESFELQGCAIYMLKGGEKGEKHPAGPSKPTSPTTKAPQAACTSTSPPKTNTACGVK